MPKNILFILSILMVLFVSSSVYAGQQEDMKAVTPSTQASLIVTGKPEGISARREPDFLNPAMVLGTLPPQTEGTILQSKTLHSGSRGHKIKVTSSKDKKWIGQEVWVYEDKDEKTRRVKLNKNNESLLVSQKPLETQENNCSACHGGRVSILNPRFLDSIQATSRKIESNENIPKSLDRIIKNYSESTAVSNLIKYAKSGTSYKVENGKRIKKADNEPARQCTRAVKDATVKAGLISKEERPSSVPAIKILDDYKKLGFINLLDTEMKSHIENPDQAPKGSILVYSSEPIKPLNNKKRKADPEVNCLVYHTCGHTEIKTTPPGQGGYVSDFQTNTAITNLPEAWAVSRRYQLVGVLIRDVGGSN
jgi:hypothetical protein